MPEITQAPVGARLAREPATSVFSDAPLNRSSRASRIAAHSLQQDFTYMHLKNNQMKK
jgi:hypothetical protein